MFSAVSVSCEAAVIQDKIVHHRYAFAVLSLCNKCCKFIGRVVITPVCAQADNERKLPNNKRKNLFTFPVSHLFPIPYYLLHLFAGKSRRDVLQEDVNRITL